MLLFTSHSFYYVVRHCEERDALIHKRQASNLKEAIFEVIAELSLYTHKTCVFARSTCGSLKNQGVSVESAAVVIARNANMKTAAKGHPE